MKTGDSEEYKNVLLFWIIIACILVAILTGMSIYFYDVSSKDVEIADGIIPRKEYQAIYLLPQEKHADDKYRLNDFLVAASRMGIRAYAVDNISNNEECLESIRNYVERDVSIIVSPSRKLNECINSAVKEYGNTQNVYFVSAYDRNLKPSDKLITFKVHLYQVYYLGGVIAANVNTDTDESFFFVVSDLNEDAYRNINAFTIGVRKYKKNGVVKVVVLKSKNENIQYAQLVDALRKNPGVRLMTADYTDVTVDDFCEQKMYYCIRYDRDFASKYFSSNIASIMVDYRGFFSRVLSRTVTNSFEPGNYLLDVSTGTVRITNFNAGIIPPNTLQSLDLMFSNFMGRSDNIFSGPLYDNEHHLRLDKGSVLQDSPKQIFSMDWFVEGVSVE